MDASIDLERDPALATETGDERPDRAPPSARSPIEEATFVVLESGRIRFYVCPRVEVEIPTSLEDVQTFSFTLTPRNRDVSRRLSVVKKRLPDQAGRDKQWITVDRVGSATGRGKEHVGNLEIASGTYAITSHRDHVHFLYELDPDNKAVLSSLLRQLRIGPRSSYLAAVLRGAGKSHSCEDDCWINDPTKFRALDPMLLEREGTEFVLSSGEPLRVDFATPNHHL